MTCHRARFWPLLLLLALPLCIAADSQPAPADPHQHLNAILERPMYRAWKLREQTSTHELKPPEAFWQWVKRAGDTIGDFFDWLFRSRNRPRSRPSSASVLPAMLKTLAWGVAIAAVLVIVYFIYKTTARPIDLAASAHILSRQQVEEALESGDALSLGPSQWLDEAQRLAAEQNFRAVYRALYLALLSGLHTAGKIEHNRNRTNWTYVQLYHGPVDERAVFSELTEVFDRVWYGHKIVPEQSNFEDLRAKVMMLTRVGVGG